MKILTNKTTYGETNEQQTNNKQITTNKNDKNIKNEKEVEEAEEKKSAAATDTENCFKFYMENINPIITQYETELLKDYLTDLSDELIIYAIKEAVEHNARSMKYIKSILDRYVRQNIKTLEQLKALENIKQDTKEETEEEKKARKIRELEEAIANDY